MSFTRVVVDDSSPANPWIKVAADVSNDGIDDIVVCGQNGPLVGYVAPDWNPITIAEGAGSDSGGAAGDLDGDGDVDLAIGQQWFENPGTGQGGWQRHLIPSIGDHDVVVADVDGDDRLDVLTRSETQSAVSLLHNTGGGVFERRDLAASTGLNGLGVGDLDNDGDLDIALPGIWLENPGATFMTDTWPEHEFGDWSAYAAIQVVDLSGDGLPDIVMSTSEEPGPIAFFEQPETPRGSAWPRKDIDPSSLESVHGFGLADLDLDGDLDLVASEFRGTGRTLAYFNDGSANFSAQELARDTLHNLVVADVDGDGDADAFGALAFGVGPVVLYQNDAPREIRQVLVFSRTLEFRHASIPDAVAALQDTAADHGFEVTATEDAAIFTDESLGQFAAIVFLSPSGDILDVDQRAAFQAYVEAGGGFVGIHNATAYVLEDWDWYTNLVGARFQEEIDTQPTTLQVLVDDHPSTTPLPSQWTRIDETYLFDRDPRESGATVLVEMEVPRVREDQPYSWYHEYEGGRSWYTVGGAEVSAWSEELFLLHVWGGITYAAGTPRSTPAPGGGAPGAEGGAPSSDPDPPGSGGLGGAPEGGAGESGQGGNGAGVGVSGDGGTRSTETARDARGCGCRAAGGSDAQNLVWLVLAMLAMTRRRRDRSERSSPAACSELD